jgi:hypothetical protein
MLFEGMTDEALDIVTATRSRQEGRLRSPWNDVEYGDHYVRAMSSWSLLEAAAGYRYDGGVGRIAFAPRLGAKDFRCLFVAGEGWGRFGQRLTDAALRAELRLDWGRLTLRELSLAIAADDVRLTLEGRSLPAAIQANGAGLDVRFAEPVTILAGQALSVEGSTK